MGKAETKKKEKKKKKKTGKPIVNHPFPLAILITRLIVMLFGRWPKKKDIDAYRKEREQARGSSILVAVIITTSIPK